LGRPAISTYVAGIPELIQEGVSGWLVPAGSVEALADAMETALEMPIEQLEKMGKAGAQKVQEQHNAATEALQLANLFLAYQTEPQGTEIKASSPLAVSQG
jgi:glycosyltransferase involved in cell wall biosynthesis